MKDDFHPHSTWKNLKWSDLEWLQYSDEKLWFRDSKKEEPKRGKICFLEDFRREIHVNLDDFPNATFPFKYASVNK